MTVKNQSGIKPVGYRVLVRPDPIDKMTKGGIYIPPSTLEQHSNAQTLGTLVEAGTDAWDKWPAKWAAPGDRVLFAKYGGLDLRGSDGEVYRLLNDQQITAVVSAKVKLSDLEVHETRKSYE